MRILKDDSQNSLILDHLKRGETLTPLQALGLFNCLRLSGRILELRRMGHLIDCEMIELPNGKRVAQYSLGVRTAFDQLVSMPAALELSA